MNIQPNIPPLVALVYRLGKGCRTSRHPYRDETLRVIVVVDRMFVADKFMPAVNAAEFVRSHHLTEVSQ